MDKLFRFGRIWIWTVFLHLLLFMISCNVAQDHCEGLTVFREDEKINTSSVCIKTYKTNDCMNFTRSFNQSDLPQGYPESAYSVEKPSYINLQGLDSLHGGYIFPGMSIMWKNPKSGLSRLNCYGYLLVWNYESPTDNTQCVLFWMRNGTDKELRFQYDLEYVQAISNYRVKVHSMPPYHPEEKDEDGTFVSMYIQTPNWRYPVVSPGNWTPFLAYNTFSDGTIDLKITLPPADYNITNFSIYLKNLDQNIITAQIQEFVTELRTEEHTQASVSLHAMTSGNYSIVVWVKDEFHKIENKCRCWTIIDDQRTCMNACGGTQTRFYLNITNPATTSRTPTTTVVKSEDTIKTTTAVISEDTITTGFTSTSTSTTTAPETSSSVSVTETPNVGTIIGAVFAATSLVSVIVACMIKRNKKVRKCLHFIIGNISRRKSEEVEANGGPPIDNGIHESSIARKTVYILSADDHEAHMKLVESFIHFLKIHCQCDVIAPTDKELCTTDSFEWFQSKIHSCDYIIFIDSEAAQRLTEAHLERMTYRMRRSDPHGEVFLYGLKHIMFNQEIRETKVILVSFHSNHCKKYLQVPRIYLLPQELPHLLKKIHGLTSADPELHSQVPMVVENIQELTEGNAMLSAIKKARSYEASNPNWFKSNFGDPKPMYQKELSNDSGHPPSLYLGDSVSRVIGCHEISGLKPAYNHDQSSWITSISSQIPENNNHHSLEQNVNDETIIPPETLSCITYTDYSSVEAAIDDIGNRVKDEHMPIIEKPKFMEGIIPPDTLSDIESDNVSSALGNFNTDTDFMNITKTVVKRTPCLIQELNINQDSNFYSSSV